MAPYIALSLRGDRYHLRHKPSNQSRNNVVAFACRKMQLLVAVVSH